MTLTESKILDGINSVLYAAYPNTPVHVNLVPADFSRPAFAIIPGEKSAKHAACLLIERNEAYTVVEFLPTNEKGESIREELYAAQMRLMQLFSKPFSAGDRMLMPAEVKALTINDLGEIGIVIRLNFLDDAAENDTETETDEMMETVFIKNISENTEVINGTSPA